MAEHQLPLRTAGPARGVGICLSGGGIRAASFALGALQALDAGRQLLYGRDRADYLAAVSGGSYVAATATAVSCQLSSDEPPGDRRRPLQAGSPEANHILTNGDYLKQWGRFTIAGNWLAVLMLTAVALGTASWLELPVGWTVALCAGVAVLAALLAWRRWLLTASLFGVSGVINVAGFAALALLSAAGLVATRDYLVKASGNVDWLEPVVQPSLAGDLWWLPFAILALLGGRFALRTLYRTNRTLWRLALGVIAVIAGTPGLVYVLNGDPLPDPLGPLVLAVPLAVFAQGWPTRWRARTVVDVPLTGAAQFAGLLVLGFAIDVVRDRFERGERWPLFLVMIGGWIAVSILLGRTSLHHLNRNRLARCFCLERPPAPGDPAIHVPPAERNLTGLRPPANANPERSFPPLLVCATANVDDREPTRPTWRRYQPFIFSHDACGLQSEPDLQFPTEKLEDITRPVFAHDEPVVTLMSAVACAGAAVSPSMGNKTISGIRSLVALVNLRLGTWMPNPHSELIRGEVEAGEWRPDRHWALGGGFDEFVPELFGLQRDDAPRAYVSDGGHYDNLGLLALLRLRCETIWCVDAQADRKGRAGQLRKVIKLASDEGLFTSLSLNGDEQNLYDVFGHADGRDGAGHAIYDIAYEGGDSAKLVVIKLGLTPESDASLREFNRRDLWFGGKFPYDQTFCRIAFSDQRVERYRRLGWENACRAIGDFAEYHEADLAPDAAPQ
jgi:hypothetical protein